MKSIFLNLSLILLLLVTSCNSKEKKEVKNNTTVTEENSYLVPALAVGMFFVSDTYLAGGGLQCTYGPINDRG